MILKFKKIILAASFLLFCDAPLFSFYQSPSSVLLITHKKEIEKNGNKCEVNELQCPNAFSPNGDGNNDAFCLDGWQSCVNQFEMLIFNRFGELVFESKSPELCWDGSYKGQVLDNGVFLYVIKAQTKEGLEFKKSGNITLLR